MSTEATTESAAHDDLTTGGDLRVAIKTEDLGRILRILSPKTSQGAVFPAIDLSMVGVADGYELRSNHADKMGTYLQSLEFHLPESGQSEGHVGIEDVDRLVSITESGLFAGDVALQEADNRLQLTGDGSSAQIALVPVSRVPRSEKPDQYGYGPKGEPVRTSATRRPAPRSEWSVWAKEKGYAVCHLTAEHTAKIVAAGKLMTERYEKAVLIRFTQVNGILTVRAEPIGSRAAAVADPVSVVLGEVAEKGSPDFTLGTKFHGFDALLGVLKHLDTQRTVLLYHPQEKGGNLLSAECDEKGEPVLVLGQTFSGWATDSGEGGKSAKK
jgi:hypothetical protein